MTTPLRGAQIHYYIGRKQYCFSCRIVSQHGMTLPLIENPIKKVQLVVTGDEGEVYIDELGGDDENEDGSDNTGRRTR